MRNLKYPNMAEKTERKIKPFWRKDGTDYIARLGRLDKAIVIRFFSPLYPIKNTSYYAIANASFLPFTKEEHDKKFDDPIDCIEFAESIVLEWVQSLFLTDEQNLKSITSDQKPLGIENSIN